MAYKPELAKEMVKYYLGRGWQVRYTRGQFNPRNVRQTEEFFAYVELTGRNCLASTDHNSRTIWLNHKAIKNKIDLMEILKHEIAHALVPRIRKCHCVRWQYAYVDLLKDGKFYTFNKDAVRAIFDKNIIFTGLQPSKLINKRIYA